MSKFILDENIPDVNKSVPLLFETGDILKDISATGKERPWILHKEQTLHLANVFRTAYQQDKTLISLQRLYDLEHCGDTLVFSVDTSGNKKLKSANFCRVRLCPMCQWRRSLKLFAQTSLIAGEILRRCPDVKFLFTTFTIKNCVADDLKDTLNKLNKRFYYLTNKNVTFKPATKLKQNLLGYLKAMEITYNTKDKTFHPHLHCIFVMDKKYFRYDNYMSKKEWIQLWKSALNVDYNPQIDVKVVNSNAKAIAEVAKYPVKSDPILKLDLDEAVKVLQTFVHTLAKKRFISYGGLFKQVRKELKCVDIESDKADLINVSIQKEDFYPVFEIMYKFNRFFGCYLS